MWKQDLKKIAMLTVGVGGAFALYNSRQQRTNSLNSFLHPNQCVQIFENSFRGVVMDKTKEVAEDKEKDVKETGALYKTKMVEELKKNPSTILEDAGEKLEVAKEAAEKKLEVAKEAVEEKVEEVKEKMVPSKDDDGSSAKNDDSD